MSCIENIIGLAPEECVCFPITDETFNITESQSGYFLSNLEGLDITGLDTKTCTNDSIYTKMNKAFQLACLDVERDIKTNLKFKKQKARVDWNPSAKSYIGKKTGKSHKSFEGWAVWEIAVKKLEGSSIALNSISHNFDSAGNIDVQILDYDLNTIQTVTLTQTVPNTWEETETNIVLDWGDCGACYYVAYEYNGMNPYRNDACKCGGPAWLKWMEINTYNTPNIENLQNNKKSCRCYKLSNLFGLRLNMCTSCEVDICEMVKGDLVDQLASAIMYRAGFHLLSFISKSNNITAYTLLNKQDCNSRLQTYNGEYQHWLNFVCEQLITDCYCKKTRSKKISR